MHAVVDKICGRPGVLEAWQVPLKEREAVSWAVESAVRKLVQPPRNVDEEKLKALAVVIFEGADQQVIDACLRVVQVRTEELCEHFDGGLCRAQLSKQHLKSFNWSLRIVAGSDQAHNTCIPLVVFQLVLVDNGVENVQVLELGMNELDVFLETIENSLETHLL